MQMLRSLLIVLATSAAACGPTSPPHEPTGSSSTGEPATLCDGPGVGMAGDLCVTACDCCSLNCSTVTQTDGGMANVCSGNCADASTP